MWIKQNNEFILVKKTKVEVFVPGLGINYPDKHFYIETNKPVVIFKEADKEVPLNTRIAIKEVMKESVRLSLQNFLNRTKPKLDFEKGSIQKNI